MWLKYLLAYYFTYFFVQLLDYYFCCCCFCCVSVFWLNFISFVLLQGKSEPRSDSASGSVDISDLTNQKDDRDERRTPTPEPTVANNRKSPVIVRSASDDSLTLISVLSSRRDIDLENYILEHSITIAPKLEPAYSEPPFPKLQEVNQTYMHLDNTHLCPPTSSSIGCYDNKSDTELELERRRSKSKPCRRRRRKCFISPNPNELTLAQKLILHKQVMAYRESRNDSEVQ